VEYYLPASKGTQVGRVPGVLSGTWRQVCLPDDRLSWWPFQMPSLEACCSIQIRQQAAPTACTPGSCARHAHGCLGARIHDASPSCVAMLQPSSMEQKFLAVGAGKQHRPPGIVDNTLDAPTAALMGEQMLAVQNTL
jgi:hypothetical protein